MKILHFGKSIAHAKWPSYCQVFFSQKHAENDSTECIELFCAKNRVQNTKRDNTAEKEEKEKLISNSKERTWSVLVYFIILPVLLGR